MCDVIATTADHGLGLIRSTRYALALNLDSGILEAKICLGSFATDDRAAIDYAISAIIRKNRLKFGHCAARYITAW